jgi:hypothetical protein
VRSQCADPVDALLPLERVLAGPLVRRVLRYGRRSAQQLRKIGPEATTFLACARVCNFYAFMLGLVATVILVMSPDGPTAWAAVLYAVAGVLIACSFVRVWTARKAKARWLRK